MFFWFNANFIQHVIGKSQLRHHAVFEVADVVNPGDYVAIAIDDKCRRNS